MKPVTTIAIGIFAMVAVLHVIRMLFAWEVIINGLTIPMWVSVLGALIAGGLALAL